MDKFLLIPAQMQAPAWLKDDSASIKLITGEVSDEQFMMISKFKKVNGWLGFAANKFDLGEFPDENAPSRDTKSPSQRLRNILFVLHLQSGGTKETFTPHYEAQMEKIIATVKNALDAL